MKDDRADRRSQSYLAATLVQYGQYNLKRGNLEEAIELLREGLSAYKQSSAEDPDQDALFAARASEILARAFIKRGEWDQATGALVTGEAFLEKIGDSSRVYDAALSTRGSYELTHAEIERKRGNVSAQLSRLVSAEQLYRELNKAIPDVPRYQASLVATLADRGIALQELGLSVEASGPLNDALESSLALHRAFGNDGEFLGIS